VGDDAVAKDGLGDVIVVGNESGVWDFDVACAVTVCAVVTTSVVRTTDPFDNVIVLVFDVKDVCAEGPKGAEMMIEFELEEVCLGTRSENRCAGRTLGNNTC
jgi:hypothetical protein